MNSAKPFATSPPPSSTSRLISSGDRRTKADTEHHCLVRQADAFVTTEELAAARAQRMTAENSGAKVTQGRRYCDSFYRRCTYLFTRHSLSVLLRGSPPVVLAFPVLFSIVDCRAPQRNRPPAGLEYDGGPAAAFDRGIIELACPTWRRRRWAAAPARPEAAQEDGTD